MARGFGYEYYQVLNTCIESNRARGLYIRDLRIVTDFHISRAQADIRYASSMFTPLTEMFLVSRQIVHVFNRNRDGVYVSGIGFKKGQARELVDTLSLGIGKSDESAKEADRLYKIIWGLATET